MRGVVLRLCSVCVLAFIAFDVVAFFFVACVLVMFGGLTRGLFFIALGRWSDVVLRL